MAKEIPYFRFTVQEWQNGNISMESYELKGLFIDVCGFYWVKDCSIDIALLEKRFKDAKDLLEQLFSLDIIKVDREGNVNINFLDDQFDLLSEKRQKRQEAGRKGGLSKSSNAKAMLKQKPSYKDKDNDKYKDKDNSDLNFPEESKSIKTFQSDDEPEFSADQLERIQKATQKVASFFKISEIHQPNHWMKISRFIEFHARNGNLDYLADQFTAYRQLKEKNGYKHTWLKWIGDPSDKPTPYCEGSWNLENWKGKLEDEDLKSPHTAQVKSSVSYNELAKKTIALSQR